MKTTDIRCDGCGGNLLYTGNSIDYRLALNVERKPSRGGFVTDMMIYPPLERDHHFCDLRCLDHWRSRENHKNDLWRAWWEKWKEEHGTRHGGGMVSYPDPPQELRSEKKAEFELAALSAFPLKSAR
jgi:hypothetical protein